MNMPTWLGMWAEAFVITQLVEMPLYTWRLLPVVGTLGAAVPAAALAGETPTLSDFSAARVARAAILAFAASAITHPAVWFIFPPLFRGALGTGYGAMLAAAEIFAVLVEAAFLWSLGVRRALLWSLAANGLSVSVGLLMRYANV